ncbi:MAG: flagellar motor stator protein MotA [Alphaproteobacteria bacterium]|nr:flagellar motor stator protein MotA [Alphaproteobacteria bacterium]
MFPIIGFVIVFSSCIGGFMLAGGNPLLLFQPVEFLVILGTAIGALLIGVPSHILSHLIKDIPQIFKGGKYKKQDYLEMLVFLAVFLKAVKTKGFLSVEQHVEKPLESDIFLKFSKFVFDDALLNFTQQYLRTIGMGVDNPYHLDEVIAAEIEQQSHVYLKESAKVLQTLADGLPALGIVAAVLGVILAMAAIAEPPEILGHLIGAALVGTFFGVFVSYGIVGPLGGHLTAINEEDMNMYKCIHQVISSFLHGYAPSIAVELGRKILPINCKPTFEALEEAILQASSKGATSESENKE